jgi:SMC interacting uncharacterized protein involved in chromosome segregation
MTDLSVHVKSLQSRIDDLDERLRNQRLKDHQRHDLQAERRSLLRSLIHYYAYLLKDAA